MILQTKDYTLDPNGTHKVWVVGLELYNDLWELTPGTKGQHQGMAERGYTNFFTIVGSDPIIVTPTPPDSPADEMELMLGFIEEQRNREG